VAARVLTPLNTRGKPIAWSLLALCLLPLVAFAARVVPLATAAGVGATVMQASLPPTVRSDLSSGLTNRILLQVVLRRAGAVIAQRTVEVRVKYDLWDETYQMTVSVEGAAGVASTFRKIEEVTGALENLRLPGLFAPSELSEGNRYELGVRILFDPIEKARMEELQRWVEENSSAAPPAAPDLGPGAQASPPLSPSRSLFDRIFEQYAAGATVAAVWQDSAVSAPFEPQDLRREAPP
jgi:hypothetical protein